ncbi:alpha-catulin [Herpailurus yagouaroundi]|uniref:alpha-catulin n=1 Tax=Herpailurus yagouaroundi TaxID=1608482 RepID=UPI001AD6AF2C|nr:alpha-catulin [Puma yagouaroundi]
MAVAGHNYWYKYQDHRRELRALRQDFRAAKIDNDIVSPEISGAEVPPECYTVLIRRLELPQCSSDRVMTQKVSQLWDVFLEPPNRETHLFGHSEEGLQKFHRTQIMWCEKGCVWRVDAGHLKEVKRSNAEAGALSALVKVALVDKEVKTLPTHRTVVLLYQLVQLPEVIVGIGVRTSHLSGGRNALLGTIVLASITTLINHKDNTKKSDKTLQAIQRVGQAVNLAVGRFVKVGEAIANENWDLKEEITIACIEAKQAGETIAALTDISSLNHPESDGQITIFADKTGVIKAARLLLSSVTKVLLLADRVVIKQIITSRNKVLATMERLEKVNSFQEFVQIFSQFGNEMVEFAHLTGDRQNDLKDEKKKAKMAAARAVLEKCTMMLLTASKTCLRHPNCESAHKNKEGVFDRMKVALDKVIEIVTDCKPSGETDMSSVSIFSGIKEFKMNIEALRENLYFQSKENLSATLEVILERTEDFTDSAYTSHEHRERILELSTQARLELRQLISVWIQSQSKKTKSIAEELELSVLKISHSLNELKKELHSTATQLAADLLKYHADHVVLKALKLTGVEGNLEGLAEYACKLSEQKEQLVEACRLLRHISGTEPLEITCVHAEETFQVTGQQIISAAETLTLHPSSKIAKENLDVFCEAWESQISDISTLLREINDVFEGRRGEKYGYLSLPRPMKNNANLKSLKADKPDSEEQAKIAKLGLKLGLLTSDANCEIKKWEDQENEIVRNGRNMSSMAYSLYLFTRGEGPLKTSQDLIHQLEVFAEEGLKLASNVQVFSKQLKDDDKLLLLLEINKLSPLCHQLQTITKTPLQNQVFLKVDKCITKTRSMMAILVQLLSLCYKLLKKLQMENNRWVSVTNKDSMDGKT